MSISGHDIGFSAKGWDTLKSTVVKTAQELDEISNDEYINSLFDLNITDWAIDTIQSEEDHDGSWIYSTRAVVKLQGKVVFPTQTTEEEAKQKIEKDFIDNEVWKNQSACAEVVYEIDAAFEGLEVNKKAFAKVNSITRVENNSYNVVLTIFIDASSGESARQRHSKQIAHEKESDPSL